MSSHKEQSGQSGQTGPEAVAQVAQQQKQTSLSGVCVSSLCLQRGDVDTESGC